MITLSSGLKNSFIVLEHLRNDEQLRDIEISVGAFTNCREQGLTFMLWNGEESFTWCTYEHRNSDEIIVNGKQGHISISGDLPYAEDNKYSYLKAFKYNAHEECANYLVECFLKFAKEASTNLTTKEEEK